MWASLGLDPAERVVHLDRLGTTVRVLELGKGPPVVFVHGGSASGANWARWLLISTGSAVSWSIDPDAV